ncbi:MAG TPA: tail fiber protein [Blastocatellia bacterium]|nr:tail fiber protein [Blastocatellia bacterium]
MSSPYIGEIRMFGGNFAPQGWAFCSGQTIPISQNDTLFTLIGTTYGGDGQETFNLPNLQGRMPVHQGTGPGLSNYVIGQMGGTETVTLTVNQIPVHNHPFTANSASGTQSSPANGVSATNTQNQFSAANAVQPMNPVMGPSGGSQPHENMMSFLVIDFIISLFGIFPSQN